MLNFGRLQGNQLSLNHVAAASDFSVPIGRNSQTDHEQNVSSLENQLSSDSQANFHS